MAFTGAFTISQIEPGSFIITDTSSYSSEGTGTFSSRRIYLYKADGTTLVPDGTTTEYINFPFGEGNIKTLDVLNVDYSLNIVMVWTSVSPQPGSVYTFSQISTFTWNLELFYSGLTRLQVSNPLLINDKNYFTNKGKLRTLIDDATQATVYGADQFKAQGSLTAATYMQANENTFF